MRAEFPRKVKAEAFQRASGQCEGCGSRLHTGKFHYDHDLPDWLGGEPTLANCRVLCVACHSTKTREHDVPRIAKTKRQRDTHIGAKPKGRGFPEPARRGRASAPLTKQLPPRRLGQ